LLGAFALFEIGNLAATLLILRATDLLRPAHGLQSATQIAFALYTAYNIATTVVSFPAGKLSDRLGHHGPLLVVAAGVAAFPRSYLLRRYWSGDRAARSRVRRRWDRASAAPKPPNTPP
jgi:MFS family permease